MLQDLGHRIRCQREKRGLRQNDIANALQISPQAVSKWERGENAPDIALLVPLARLLGVSLDWLLDRYSADLDVFEASIVSMGVQIARQKSEEMTTRDFAAWANGYCFQMTNAVMRYNGVPIKYIGPGLLCFFSGAGHGERAVRAAFHAAAGASDALKIGLGFGEIYLGSIGHPDYARPDIIGESVGIAMQARDWAAGHSKSGIAAMSSLAEQLSEDFQKSIGIGKAVKTRLEAIKHPVELVEIRGN